MVWRDKTDLISSLSQKVFIFLFLHATYGFMEEVSWRNDKNIYLDTPCLQLRFHISNLITKTYLYNFDPLKPHFYIVKLGFTGVTLFFLFLLKNIDCGFLLEPPQWGSSNEYPQSVFWTEIWKISEFFIWKLFFFTVKFSIYLNRRVFIMCLQKPVDKMLFQPQCIDSFLTSPPMYAL